MKTFFRHPQSLFITALVFVIGRVSTAFGNPTGLTVASGSASTQQNGSQLNVTVSQLAILNWQNFDIQKGETTSFLQPTTGSIVFNIIGGANPSQIFGHLNGNGTVILANANGFYFGPDSMIKVGGSFIATTAGLPPDFGSGAAWQFAGAPPLASIINYGQIEVGTGKSLYLIAEKIENHGNLSAPEGDAELLAGDNVLVSERPDGRGLSATVQMPDGSVDNFGHITADAGTIALQAKVVNQDGILQADSIANHNGVIELVASDSLSLGADSQILARGDDSARGSAGGGVTLKSANVFSDADGSSIATTGGVKGGNGGNIEVSAPNIESLNSAMDARAAAAYTGGRLLLDPVDIVLNSSGSTTMQPAGGTVDGSAGNLTDTWTVNVNTAFKNKNFSQILLEASGNISLSSGVTWDLSASTGLTAGQLIMEAGGDILFGNNSKIVDANDWGVSLYAGYNFGSGSLNSGTGNIYLNGGAGLTQNGSIQLAAGDINLYAGQSILVAPVNSQIVSGSIFTTGGGNIFAYAMAGDIIAGTSNGGKTANSQGGDYNFADDGYTPSLFLGGISTAAGGNVTLIAGNNIDSTPIVPARQAPGASGTYESGDVTLVAGGQITGNYTLAAGTGTLLAGVKASGAQAAALQTPAADPVAYAATLNDLKQAVMQSPNPSGNIGAAPVNGTASSAPVTLGLISGSWNAWAANDISIKQVLNPDGAFNSLQSFLYDYDPNAAVNFWAGNAIELVGGSYGSAASSVKQTPIYAPILSLNAGAGGIQIDKSILLAPSSAGSLSIVTRNGGNLNGALVAGSTVLNGITMSDSAAADYTTYSSEHDNIHLNDPSLQPVLLNIDGSINSFSLSAPTFADINVQGNTYNFGFKGRNLSASQITSINVAGNITYRGNLTTITLTPAQLADLLPAQLFKDGSDLSAISRLIYDPTTGKLIYIGVMTTADLAFLLNPTLVVRDKNGNVILQQQVDGEGNPILDENGNPIIIQETKPLVLDATQQALINQLYIASQDASLGDQGLVLTGPGKFNVSANSIDLGVSGGIRVTAPDAGLAALTPYGADLNVTTVGDLTMTSSKISNESLLGDVNVNAGGEVDLGGQFTTAGDAGTPKGIFATSSGDVSVIANGSVNVSGSRIAAYDGGNLTVESLNGDVNAGSGGAGYVTMTSLELDPHTGRLTSIAAIIPGSGLLATTVPGSHAKIGNVLVETPNGSISSSSGGVVQISFNGTDDSAAIAMLLAGYELRDTTGTRRLTAADLLAGYSTTDVADAGQSFNLLDIAGNVVGKVAYVSPSRDLDATPAGVIAQNVIAKVTGKISGLLVGNTVDAGAHELGPIVIFSVEPPKIGDGNGGTPPPSDGSDSPVIISTGISTAPPPTAAAAVVAQVADSASSVTTKTEDQDEGLAGNGKNPGKGISLAQKVSRVTVILPKKD